MMPPAKITGTVRERQTLGDMVRADMRRRARHVSRTLTAYHARTHLRGVVTDRVDTARDLLRAGPIRRRVSATTGRVTGLAERRRDGRTRKGWTDNAEQRLMGGDGPQPEPGPECDTWSTPLTINRNWRSQRSGSCTGCRDWIIIPLGHFKIPPHESGPPTVERCPSCGRHYPEGRGPWYTDPPCNDCAKKTDRQSILDGRSVGDLTEGEDDVDDDA